MLGRPSGDGRGPREVTVDDTSILSLVSEPSPLWDLGIGRSVQCPLVIVCRDTSQVVDVEFSRLVSGEAEAPGHLTDTFLVTRVQEGRTLVSFGRCELTLVLECSSDSSRHITAPRLSRWVSVTDLRRTGSQPRRSPRGFPTRRRRRGLDSDLSWCRTRCLLSVPGTVGCAILDPQPRSRLFPGVPPSRLVQWTRPTDFRRPGGLRRRGRRHVCCPTLVLPSPPGRWRGVVWASGMERQLDEEVPPIPVWVVQVDRWRSGTLHLLSRDTPSLLLTETRGGSSVLSAVGGSHESLGPPCWGHSTGHSPPSDLSPRFPYFGRSTQSTFPFNPRRNPLSSFPVFVLPFVPPGEVGSGMFVRPVVGRHPSDTGDSDAGYCVGGGDVGTPRRVLGEIRLPSPLPEVPGKGLVVTGWVARPSGVGAWTWGPRYPSRASWSIRACGRHLQCTCIRRFYPPAESCPNARRPLRAHSGCSRRRRL